MKTILFAAIFAMILASCQSCQKDDDVPGAPPFVSQSSPAIAESENSFQPTPYASIVADAPAALVVYKAENPVPVIVNGTQTTLYTTAQPDTLFVGTGDTISIHPNGWADVRWIYV